MMLTRSGQNGPCLSLYLRSEPSAFSLLSLMLVVYFLHLFFIELRKFPSVSSLCMRVG